MREVEDALVVGIRVDGGHEAFFDAEVVVEDFCNWCQTVGSTRSVGNNIVSHWIVFVVVYSENHCEVCFFAGSADEHLLSACCEVFACACFVCEETC